MARWDSRTKGLIGAFLSGTQGRTERTIIWWLKNRMLLAECDGYFGEEIGRLRSKVSKVCQGAIRSENREHAPLPGKRF